MDMLTNQIKQTIDQCVLCWLASSSAENMPNVSPKEIFTHFNQQIIIANIASPQTVKNILQNQQVCLSIVQIFIQKGYQIKGKANIIDATNEGFKTKEEKLLKMTGDKFPFSTITVIQPESIKEIWAPSYLLYPDTTTEAAQIKNAEKSYMKILKNLKLNK